ncbi:MAG TPA: imidazoleglycerol-phosphate dehydratase HisB [Candidatus Blautia avicola]|uniref:Imidazoleglycerol-phosphate dehydratase n=1 Tax=Candidatus Blautia avicola TaxID=2838483 RepID=A0A9D2QT52_9FIRM|nr:imidazoleglycerol-phosphate dehydratase HisB [Candidatus Blautia avicola]
MRVGKAERNTRETQISLSWDLDGKGRYNGTCGVGFFDHMLQALCVHGGFDIDLTMKGDLEVDCHHSIEDLGIVLGMALKEALRDKGGIRRYGSFYIPMDEALGFCALDVSGRAFLVFDASFENPSVGALDCCMVKEFFRALAFQAGITLHLKVLYGENDHHKIEAIFKAFAHALREAVTETDKGVLSSKGVL